MKQGLGSWLWFFAGMVLQFLVIVKHFWHCMCIDIWTLNSRGCIGNSMSSLDMENRICEDFHGNQCHSQRIQDLWVVLTVHTCRIAHRRSHGRNQVVCEECELHSEEIRVLFPIHFFMEERPKKGGVRLQHIFQVLSWPHNPLAQEARNVLEDLGVTDLLEVQIYRTPRDRWVNDQQPSHCTLFLKFGSRQALDHCWGLLADQWVDGLVNPASHRSFLAAFNSGNVSSSNYMWTQVIWTQVITCEPK